MLCAKRASVCPLEDLYLGNKVLPFTNCSSAKMPLRIYFGRDIDGISEALFEFKFRSAVMTIQDFHRHLFCFGLLEYLNFLSMRVFPFLFKGPGAVLVFELS